MSYGELSALCSKIRTELGIKTLSKEYRKQLEATLESLYTLMRLM